MHPGDSICGVRDEFNLGLCHRGIHGQGHDAGGDFVGDGQVEIRAVVQVRVEGLRVHGRVEVDGGADALGAEGGEEFGAVDGFEFERVHLVDVYAAGFFDGK